MLAEQLDQIIVLVNRKAGSGNRQALVGDLAGLLEQRGFSVRLIDSVSEYIQAVNGKGRGVRCIVAAGGDGTAELAASHAGDIPIAVFPLGTENLLAKYLGITAHPQRTADMIARGQTRRIDVGRVNDHAFLIMLSCGFDAEVVRRLHDGREGNITHLSYALPIIDAIRNYRYPNLHVAIETAEGRVERDCHWVFVFNAPAYAAGLQIVSDADPSDGEFDVATFSGGSFWHGLWQFSAVVLGQHHEMPEFQVHRGKRIEISSSAAEVPFQIDGDPGGFLPAEISVEPLRLTLIV